MNSRSLSTVPIQLSSPVGEPVKCAQMGCIQKREMPCISRRVRSFPTLALSKSGYGSKFATSSQPMYKLPCSIYGSTIHDPPGFVKFWTVSFLHGSVGRGIGCRPCRAPARRNPGFSEDGRLLQTELHVLEGTDRPFRNLILWPNRSAQKGRMFRIEPDGVGDFFRAEIGVAIVASVPAGVISADVDALDTPARVRVGCGLCRRGEDSR